MSENKAYGVQKQQLKHLSVNEYKAIRELCILSKNMYNVALYSIRQHFFDTGKFLSYTGNYHACKGNENYKLLNSNSAQQVMKIVDRNFKSFFELLKLKNKGNYNAKVNIPRYLEKDGFFSLIFAEFSTENNFFQVPMSPAFRKEHGKVVIKMPSNLEGRVIKEVRIIPKSNARFFEIQWIYEIPAIKENLSKNNTLAIDLGVNNLCTCVANDGDAFIVDGKKLKSFNQWANKRNAYLQSIKDKQKINGTTKAQCKLWKKRNHQVDDYISKTARIIVDHCRKHDIGHVVLGYNKDFQKDADMGKERNQTFTNIPFGDLKRKLKGLCERYGILFTEQEESYTSKADFLAGDDSPVYGEQSSQPHTFSGRRIKRGLYRSATGILLNADINGALNIMRKAGVKDITLEKKTYLSPQRIKVIKPAIKCNKKTAKAVDLLERLEHAA